MVDGIYSLRKRRVWRTALAIIPVLAFMLAACANLSRPDLERRYYAVTAQRPQSSVSFPGPSEQVLAVRTFRVAPAFDTKRLVTIQPDGEIDANFFDHLFVLPGPMFSEQFRVWLSQSRRFAYVDDLGGLRQPDFVLEGFIQELSRDLRGDVPQAVLTMQLLLLDLDHGAEPKMLLHQGYEQRVELTDQSSAALIAGWSTALERILQSLEPDIREAIRAANNGTQ
jgi:ABC-type uncharacterized transport system auxiliary subunit